MKKVLAFLLTFVIMISVMPLGAFTLTASAATSGTTGDCIWSLDGTILTISGNGAMGNYTMPSNMPPWWGNEITQIIVENGVTNIGQLAFYSSNVANVSISNSVENIGYRSFYNCDNLVSITIPNSVTNIDGGAFSDCNSLVEIDVSTNNSNYCSIDGVLFDKDATTLVQYPFGKNDRKFIIPDSVEKIGNGAFDGCANIESVEIPEGVTEIDNFAFSYCVNLNSVKIPSSVRKIGIAAFDGCDNLISVIISDLAAWCAIDNTSLVLQYVDQLVLNDKVITDLVIPEGVVRISDFAFSGYNALKSVVLPDGVTDIGRDAFCDCDNLKSIVIPSSVKTIDDYAFFCMDGSSLTDVWYTGSQTDREGITIGAPNAPLEDATWHYVDDAGVTGDCIWYLDGTTLTISGNGDMANYTGEDEENTLAPWYNKRITEVVVENGVTSIGDYAFFGCVIEDIVLPDSITKIGSCSFADTPIKSIVLPDVLEHLGDNAFFACNSLESITLPKGITSIEHSTFTWCENIKEIIVPDSVTYIGNGAFAHCWDLKNVTLGNGVESIGENAFWGCHSLTNVTIPSSVNSIGEGAFVECENVIIYGYKGSYAQKYANDNNMKFVVIKESTLMVGDANGDGTVNTRDAALVMQYANGWSVNIDEDAADVNSDGTVNTRDYALLMQYANGWGVELQ